MNSLHQLLASYIAIWSSVRYACQGMAFPGYGFVQRVCVCVCVCVCVYVCPSKL